MKVCVCGAQAPFIRGGAEQHLENMVQAFIDAGHEADLVRLPVAWDKERLFDAVIAWRMIPIDADLVVALNFPSYFVRHPRKAVWLNHQHRTAYDAVDAPWSDFGLDDESLETQRQLSDWDTRALEEAVALFTSSKVVAERLLRYNGLTAEPLYHPPPLYDRLSPGPSRGYIFCPSRLEQNKRPNLMVEAMAHTTADARLVISGRGSLDKELRDLAEDLRVTDKVEFRGFVEDDELIDLYRGASAVVYVPHDEDYGYVSLQAFYAGKPVVTTKDSGAVLEFVSHDKNGLVAEPTAQSIASAIDRLAKDPNLAERLGAKGLDAVKNLSWHSVVGRLAGR